MKTLRILLLVVFIVLFAVASFMMSSTKNTILLDVMYGISLLSGIVSLYFDTLIQEKGN